MEGSIFISLLNGQIIYEYKNHSKKRESIYQNPFGDNPSTQFYIEELAELAKFKLNNSDYQNLQNIVINRMINY